MEKALPKYKFNSILDITIEDLQKMGAKAVCFDLDNTTLYDSSYKPLAGVYEWVKYIKKSGMPIMILSNTYPLRAKRVARKFGVDYTALSKKPETKAFFIAAERMRVDVSEIAMIGDQLYADILGANEAGAISVWVKPFMVEWLFAKKYRRRRSLERELFAKHNIEY